MPLCYSNFKSFRNKSSRIFLFEQLLFSKVNKLTCKGQVGLGLDGKGWWRANTGCNQLSDAIGHSHATSIKIEGCPCKLWQPYCIILCYNLGPNCTHEVLKWKTLVSIITNILLNWATSLWMFKKKPKQQNWCWNILYSKILYRHKKSAYCLRELRSTFFLSEFYMGTSPLQLCWYKTP